MLEQLRIENFALVENAFLDFNEGLNIMTGETGAGKSLIVDALGLLLGDRASNQFIRSGAERAFVEGYFSCYNQDVKQTLIDLGLDRDADDGLMLSREITQTGRNYCRVNGKVIPLTMFQTLGHLLVDIHGQNEQLSLLSPVKQLEMLDLRGGQEILKVREKIAAIFQQIQETELALLSLQGDPGDRERQMAFYQFQIEEIEQANLQIGEEEELLQRQKILTNAEKILEGVSEAEELLFKGTMKSSAYDQISLAIEQLEPLLFIDSSLDSIVAISKNCLYQLEDVSRELQSYLSYGDFEISELDMIVQRINLLSGLKRKYGATVKDILTYQGEISLALEQLGQQEDRIQQLEEQKEQLNIKYNKIADELTKLRMESAKKLEIEMKSALEELDMPSVQFQCKFAKKNHPSEKGQDELEFYISPNLGEPLKSLVKIASGGEIARIMLALKSILANVEEVETMVFDEADSGIGGHTAIKVGHKLVQIAKSRQVICITHSPQIASFGDTHLRLYKDGAAGRTITQVEKLNSKTKIEELVRMLGGGPAEATAIEHARQLLQGAKQEKCV